VTLPVAILLGIVQGLTEFLPISSSGHLRLIQSLFGIAEPQTFFDVSLHLGTLLATVVVFARPLWDALLGGLRWLFQRTDVRSDENARLALLLVVGSLPTALIGLSLGPFFETSLSSPGHVGAFLILNGFLLQVTRGRGAEGVGRGVGEMRWRDALWIGVSQGFAVMRGISRSGSTISMALVLGINRETAARLSFLLSIPTILGALLFEWRGASEPMEMALSTWAMGVTVSFAVGFLALRFLLVVVERGAFHRFAPWCWGVGLFALASEWWGA
jgi:undecaprenyl-diphosphatase